MASTDTVETTRLVLGQIPASNFQVLPDMQEGKTYPWLVSILH